MRVYVICNAYESGFGHGVEYDEYPNPHSEGTDEHEAYDIGCKAGKEALIELDDGPFNGVKEKIKLDKINIPAITNKKPERKRFFKRECGFISR